MRIRTLAVTGLVAIALAAAAGAETLAIGADAPMTTTEMKNVDGKMVSIAAVKGEKGTLVIFSCNACPFAKAWEKRIVEIGNAAKKSGVGAIVINANDPAIVPEDGFEQMKERAKAGGYEFPYVVDATQEVAKAFGAARTPEVFLLDAKGKLVYHGAVDDDKDPTLAKSPWLKNAIDALVAGKAMPLADTKAVGCSIKWRKA